MNLLDDRPYLEDVDAGGMLGHLEGFAAQLEEAREIGLATDLRVSADGVDSIVVAGMGGSAIGGELLSGYLSDELSVPFWVVRDYTLPAFVGAGTLLIASSYSGNTEETLSAYKEAVWRGARIICSTTGGDLERLAEKHGHSTVRIPGGLPPRAALGYALIPLLIILIRLGLVSERSEEIAETIDLAGRAAATYGPDSSCDRNLAKELAGWLHGHFAVIYGTAPRTSAVAERWCAQFSENSKIVAHARELPEMNHNEIVGWSGAGVPGGSPRVIFLTDSDDHPRVARRIDTTDSMIRESGIDAKRVRSWGESRLARLLSLVIVGDFTSFYLAALGRVDPTPVVWIDRLKAALG